MPSTPQRDPGCVFDMLHYARQIVRFTSGREQHEVAANEMQLAATLYAITILGEAARRVSPEFRTRYPHIPWRQITGIRSTC